MILIKQRKTTKVLQANKVFFVVEIYGKVKWKELFSGQKQDLSVKK